MSSPPVSPPGHLRIEGPPPPPPPIDEGALPAAPPGIGADGGSLSSPKAAEKGFFQLCSDAWGDLEYYIFGFLDLLFMCVPVGEKREAARKKIVEDFFNIWFPEKIQLTPNDPKETMVSELQKLEQEDFKIILAAYNQAAEKSLNEETTLEQLVANLIEGDVVVTLEVDNEKLLRPYGLHSGDLENAIFRLPNGLQEELKERDREGKSIGEYYSENMQILKHIIDASQSN